MPNKRTIPRICRYCGNGFMAEAGQVNRGRHVFCSVACRCAGHRRPVLPILTGTDPGTALIPLPAQDGSIRAYALIDASDAEWAGQWRWHLVGTGYAGRRMWGTASSRVVLLHRELLGPMYGDDTEGDHIDRDPLNNRRGNLRPLTLAGNLQNKPSYRGSTSPYRGVSWNRRQQQWHAQIQVSGKKMHLGYFTDELEAAEAARAARARLMPYAVD